MGRIIPAGVVLFGIAIPALCEAQQQPQQVDLLDDPDRIYEQAVEYLKAGDENKTLQLLDEAIALKPLHLAANRCLQDIHIRRDTLQHLLTHYNQLVENNPEDAIAYYLLGRFKLHMGEANAARAAFERAIDEDLALYSLGEYDGSTVDALRQVLEQDRGNAVFWVVLWQLELNSEDKDVARERVIREIEDQREQLYTSPENLNVLITFLSWKLYDSEIGREARDEFIRRFPEHIDSPYHVLAQAEGSTDPHQRIPFYQQMLSEYPTSPYRLLGYSYLLGDMLLLEEYDRCMTLAKQLIDLPDAQIVDLDEARQLRSWIINMPCTLAGVGYSCWIAAAMKSGQGEEVNRAIHSLLNSTLSDPYAYFIMGRSLRRVGENLDLSIELLKAAVENLNDSNPAFQFYLIHYTGDRVNQTAAIKRGQFLEELVKVYNDVERVQDAEVAADRLTGVLDNVPRVLWSTYVTLAETYEASGRFDDAAQNYIKALEIKHGDTDLEAALARVYEKAHPGQDWQVALDDLLHPPAQPFVVEGLDGSTLTLEEFHGKVVLLNFWATWCGGCVKKLPHLVKFHERFHDKGFEVIAVSLDIDHSLVPPLIEELNLPYTIAYGTRGMADRYGVTSIPVSFLIDKRGRIRAMQLGYWDEVDQWVEEWSVLIASILQP